jgi:DNA-binding transcriptional MerR regulator
MYNLDQIANLFSTSNENARRWCITFADWLSEGANPSDHRKRLLNDDDLTVLSLVAEMRTQGHVFDTIKAALAEGKRGAMPASPASVVPADKTKLAKLQADVNRLNEALQLTIEESQRKDGRIDELTTQLESAKRDLRAAYEEIGLLKAGKNTG